MNLPIEIDTIQVQRIVYLDAKNGKRYFAIMHEGKPYFLGKSLKNTTGAPNIKAGDYVRIGYYNSDEGKTFVAYATGAKWADFVGELSRVEA